MFIYTWGNCFFIFSFNSIIIDIFPLFYYSIFYNLYFFCAEINSNIAGNIMSGRNNI